MKKTLHILLIFLFALNGCAVKVYQGNEAIENDTLDILEKSLNTAKQCENPVAAQVKLNREFKYGCFCGLGHPLIEVDNDVNISTLDDKDKIELASKYYSIKPIDSIDQACRDHDVCWILRGDGSGECNDAFRGRIEYLQDKFGERTPLMDNKSVNWRCGIMADDMHAAFLSYAVKDIYEDSAKTKSKSIGKLAGLVFGPLYILPASILWAGDNYPRASDRCMADG